MYSPISLKIKNIISFKGEHSYDFSKDPKVISGCNYDNPSQKINGAGKSAFIEALALGFSGSSIRDVKTKELVNRDSKDGEVEIVLSNSKFKRNLKIWRKVYSGSKSAECRVWLGEEEVRLSDINSYNKFIFDELGLTKDDFFNFYLLVQANYSPFLRVGDVKKKEIINRFSGADSIDQLIPLVKADLTMFDPEFDRVNRSIENERGKISAYDESLIELDEKQKSWKTEKANQLAQVHQDIKMSQQKINDSRVDVEILIEESKALRSDLIVKDYSTSKLRVNKKIGEIKASSASLKEEVATLTTSISQVKSQKVYRDAIDKIKLEEQNLNILIQSNKEEKKELEELKSELEVQLLDVIECPKCTHHFSFKNEEFNEAEAKVSLGEIDGMIEEVVSNIAKFTKQIDEDLSERKLAINAKILNEQQSIKDSIESKNEEITKLNTNLVSLNQEINIFNQNEAKEVEDIKSKISEMRRIRKLRDRETMMIKSYLKNCEAIEAVDLKGDEKKIKDNKKISEAKVIELTAEFDQLTQDRKSIAEWETNFKNFKSFVANQSIKNIEDYTNLFLKEMGSDLGIFLDGFTTLTTGKLKEQISVDVLRGGFNEGSYGAFSGGERGRIDICVILAIQQLININCSSGGLDLLICDEILDQIDTLGLESIINSLQNLERTIMVVSQNEINSLKEHVLLIEKRNKISTFIK